MKRKLVGSISEMRFFLNIEIDGEVTKVVGK